MIAAGTTVKAQDYPEEYLGLPGDNFNLYAVMKLFQESETLEGFERALNDENSRINNLDLNRDNYIDYIKVIDYVDGNVHTIVLQAALDRNESQDVAVFTVERFRDGSVQIQLTGDEDLYGRNYIIEPIFDETPNPGYLGRSNPQTTTVVRTTTVQIAAWPLVRFIYMPNYVVWRSSWYWGYYPSYWHPWRPYYWHYYYGYHYHWYPHYYSYYRHWDQHRYSRWNDSYYNRNRTYSRNVSMRINSGDYRTTYSRPESRRDGESLYAKVNPDRPARTSSMSKISDTGRRPVSQSSTTRQSTGSTSAGARRSTTTVTNRSNTNNAATPRSTTTVNNRARTNSTAGQSTVSNRRSSGTISSNPASKPGSGQGNNSVGRSTTVGNDRARTNSSTGQSTGSSRRPAATVSERPSSKSSTGQRVQSSGSSRQSTISAGSSNRRSSTAGKAASTKSETGKSKESEKSTSSRRK